MTIAGQVAVCTGMIFAFLLGYLIHTPREDAKHFMPVQFYACDVDLNTAETGVADALANHCSRVKWERKF